MGRSYRSSIIRHLVVTAPTQQSLKQDSIRIADSIAAVKQQQLKQNKQQKLRQQLTFECR